MFRNSINVIYWIGYILTLPTTNFLNEENTSFLIDVKSEYFLLFLTVS